ncbi:MAG: hypothetical protein LBK95_13785 [Bifidobacteriaceae bacterium]|jgi:electron transfer flavoprotein beta subunit|nr:hypothetical protein [Bifidobacteriaceae bacterium]
MRIVVAYKWASDPQDVRVEAEGQVDMGRARPALSDYDAVAIEVARQVAADPPTGGSEEGSEVVALSVGAESVGAPIAVKAVLARGIDRAVVVADDRFEDAGASGTARVLAEAIRHIGGVDLVVAGDCSVDSGARLVPAVLAGILGWTVLTDVTSLAREPGGALRVERVIPEGLQVLSVETPVVIAVASDAAEPRVPGMKDMMAAGRKPVERLDLTALGVDAASLAALAGTVRRLAPARRVARRGRVISAAEPSAAAAELIDALREEGMWW